MQFFTTILTIICMVNMINAMPISGTSNLETSGTSPNTTLKLEKRCSAMCENCFSCYATQKGPVLKYKLRIGAPFAGGAGCQSVKDMLAVAGDVPEIEEFSCKADKADMTKISFTAWDYNHGWGISQVMNKAYLAIKGDGYGFNCPNY